jgi:hypothetical protein
MSLMRRHALVDGSAPRTAPGDPFGDARSVARHDNDPPPCAKGDAGYLSPASPSLAHPVPEA